MTRPTNPFRAWLGATCAALLLLVASAAPTASAQDDAITGPVTLDLALRRTTDAVPFNRPFVLMGQVPKTTDRVVVAYKRTGDLDQCGSPRSRKAMQYAVWDHVPDYGHVFRVPVGPLIPDVDYTFFVSLLDALPPDPPPSDVDRLAEAVDNLAEQIDGRQDMITDAALQRNGSTVPKGEADATEDVALVWRTGAPPAQDSLCYEDIKAIIQEDLKQKTTVGDPCAACSPSRETGKIPINAGAGFLALERGTSSAGGADTVNVETTPVELRSEPPRSKNFASDIGVSVPINDLRFWGLTTGVRFYPRPRADGVDLLDPAYGGFWKQLSYRTGLFASLTILNWSPEDVKGLELGVVAAGISIDGILYWRFLGMNKKPFCRRFIQPINLNAGMLFFEQEDSNPLVDELIRKNKLFLSVSVDIGLRKLLGPIGGLFGAN